MSLFKDAHKMSLGTVEVKLEDVEFHPLQREADEKQVQQLCDAFTDDMLLRWVHPIEVVLSKPVEDQWKNRLAVCHVLPPLPPDTKLLCINGKHRVLAARRRLSEEEDELRFWPAIIYASDMLECSWLDLLMKERNMEQYTLANKDHDLMLGLDLMTAKNPDVDVYAVIAKHSHEAFAIRSLHSGRAWGGLMKLLKQPFFSDLKKETYTHWPKRWKMYQFMRLLLYDCALQHRQLRESCEEWSMAMVYGKNWEKNMQISKSGRIEEVEAQLTENNPNWLTQFGVDSAEEFRNLATKRKYKRNGGNVGELWYFGPSWISVPTALGVVKQGRFLEVLDQCEAIVSLFHVLTSPDAIHEFPAKRPRLEKNCLDWVDVLNATIVQTDVVPSGLTEGSLEVIQDILKYRIGLYHPSLVKDGLLPNERARRDKRVLVEYVEFIKGREGWETFLTMHEEAGFVYDAEKVLAVAGEVDTVAGEVDAVAGEVVAVAKSRKGGPGKPKKKRQKSKVYIVDEPEDAQPAQNGAESQIVEQVQTQPQPSQAPEVEPIRTRKRKASELTELPPVLTTLLKNTNFINYCNRLDRHDPTSFKSYVTGFAQSVGDHGLGQNSSQNSQYMEEVREEEGPPEPGERNEWETFMTRL